MLDDSLLDDAVRLLEADHSDMLRATARAGATIRESIQLSHEAGVDQLQETGRPRSVLILADGLSALGADLVVALADGFSPAPVVPLIDPLALPQWVGVSDLVLVSSFAGTHEGLLAAVDAAVRRGAMVLACAPPDAPLREVAPQDRAIYLPMPVPLPVRAAFWGGWSPLLLGAGYAEVIPVTRDDLATAADVLDGIAERCRVGSESFVNPAKALALDLDDKVPMIWAASALMGVAGRRFAAQLAGNAGTPAIFGTLPLVLAEQGGALDRRAAASTDEDLFRDRVQEPTTGGRRLVLLRDSEEPPENRQHIDQVRERADDYAIPITELVAEGRSPLERLASVIGIVDFASIYLGLTSGFDPAGEHLGQ